MTITFIRAFPYENYMCKGTYRQIVPSNIGALKGGIYRKMPKIGNLKQIVGRVFNMAVFYAAFDSQQNTTELSICRFTHTKLIIYARHCFKT